MTKLASIQKVESLMPIEGADKIECAYILGWQCVVKKGEFNVGDKCVYIQIDTVVPNDEVFSFMKDRNFRVKTIKLRKQLSQGLCLPLKYFPKISERISVGEDVTDIIGVKKYQNPELIIKKGTKKRSWFDRFIRREADKRGFPRWISKTDEERIQNIPWVLNGRPELSITEKLDGTSATYFVRKRNGLRRLLGKYDFGVCSRNFRVYPSTKTWHGKNVYWEIAEQEDIKQKMISVLEHSSVKSLVVQGEIIGVGVQGNKYKLNDLRFFVFNVIHDGIILSDIPTACSLIDMESVPVVENTIQKKDVNTSLQEMLEFAKGNSLINPNVKREGIVCRNYEKGISFKVINNDFLMEYGE